MYSPDGPYLALAVICERVLIEKDEVLSLVRIFDRWIVKGTFLEMPPTLIQLALVVSLKSGRFRGKTHVLIKPTSPGGKDLPMFQNSIEFGEKSDEQGANVVTSLAFVAEEEGIYWFDVLLDSLRLTKIPLRLAYEQAEDGSAPGQ